MKQGQKDVLGGYLSPLCSYLRSS